MSGQPHIHSYYAASVNDVTDYPALVGEHVADVCVIGAGFTGISTALFLAERGYNVHVVEANRVGWGASGRNGGQVIGGISGEHRIANYHGKAADQLISRLRWAGHAIIRERVERYRIACDLKFGYLDVAIKERHLRDLEAEKARLEAQGLPHQIRLLDRTETRAFIGTDAYIGALLNMGNGHLHPLNLCVGEARAAESRGAAVYEHSLVTDIVKGKKPKVVTRHGSVTADAVVIAGNAYHTLERQLRDNMFPVNSFIIATEPLADDVVQRINPHDVAVCDPNFVLEYFRLSADKRMLFGGRLNYFGSDPDVIRRKRQPRLAHLYPELADARIDFAWGGRIGVPINRVPQFGRVAPNVFYCQGYSGHGVNVAHLAGEILADAVSGTLERFNLFATVPAIRIPGAHLFQKPLVALAMIYYQLKDRL